MCVCETGHDCASCVCKFFRQDCILCIEDTITIIWHELTIFVLIVAVYCVCFVLIYVTKLTIEPFCIVSIAIVFIAFIQRMDPFRSFRPIAVGILLGLLDITTDISLIIEWFTTEEYLWCFLQMLILLSSQFLSVFKLGYQGSLLQSNFIALTQRDISKADRCCVSMGLGRMWLGAKSIGNHHVYYEEYCILKIYDIEYEAIPTVILQLYVALFTIFNNRYHYNDNNTNNNANNNNSNSLVLIASITITVLSISYSIWRIFARNARKYKYQIKSNANRELVTKLTSRSASSTLQSTRKDLELKLCTTPSAQSADTSLNSVDRNIAHTIDPVTPSTRNIANNSNSNVLTQSRLDKFQDILDKEKAHTQQISTTVDIAGGTYMPSQNNLSLYLFDSNGHAQSNDSMMQQEHKSSQTMNGDTDIDDDGSKIIIVDEENAYALQMQANEYQPSRANSRSSSQTRENSVHSRERSSSTHSDSRVSQFSIYDSEDGSWDFYDYSRNSSTSITDIAGINEKDVNQMDNENNITPANQATDNLNTTSKEQTNINVNKKSLTLVKSKKKEYSLWYKIIIYAFLCSDFYVRSFLISFNFYVIHVFVIVAIESESQFNIIATILFFILFVLFLLILSLFESYSLKFMRKSEYNGWNDIKSVIFISLFSSLINVLFVLPLKRFDIKNEMSKFNAEIILRYCINLVWQSIILILLNIDSRNNIFFLGNYTAIDEGDIDISVFINWSLHYACWGCVVVNFMCLFLINCEFNENLQYTQRTASTFENSFRAFLSSLKMNVTSLCQFLVTKPKLCTNNENSAYFMIQNPLILIIGIHIDNEKEKKYQNIRKDYKNCIYTFNNIFKYSILFQNRNDENVYCPSNVKLDIVGNRSFGKQFKKDWTFDEIIKYFDKAKRLCVEKEHDSIITVISCYGGSNGIILDSESNTMSIDELTKHLSNILYLKNKPKIFFIDSCQPQALMLKQACECSNLDDNYNNSRDLLYTKIYQCDEIENVRFLYFNNNYDSTQTVRRHKQGGYLIRAIKKILCNPKSLQYQKFDSLFYQIGAKTRQLAAIAVMNQEMKMDFNDINKMNQRIKFQLLN